MRRLFTLLALVVLAGCGTERTVRGENIVVEAKGTVTAPDATGQQARGVRIADARFVFITHGQASDPVWPVVKKGLDAAGRQTGAAVSYRAPDSFSIPQMRRYIDEAVADHADGLIVSVPDPVALGPSIRRAVQAGIPTITINSGSTAFKRLGVLAHVGQPEYEAGVEAGKRLAAVGVKTALCVNHEEGNAGLDDRCRGLQAGIGGRVQSLAVPLQNAMVAQRRVSAALSGEPVDAVVTLGANGALPALAAVEASGQKARIRLATFDLSPEVLTAVKEGKILFAVDQQPYLQGYLPVILLVEQVRHQIFPGKGTLIPTGPQFVTKENADATIRLAAEGIR
ncbi:sugar ABC transporter substrate-binding protein [Solirubrobacter phytolaccae]|uniref:Sugar ABC transporter substrate-binding protein n=1 Tax=Solirubrobacter phytolaccae TaxID=1404360 RepID=A0A9X3NFH5_9ACTN|nr:sugar ABC transporter substrate-binding protein [Solirubrobacter phytolaccae]MDA0185618.1 sugar ABC transporter substrate-binding protein [Solirubrobacter phytolaccae]